VKAHLAQGDAALLDARPAARFRGEAPEPRPGLASGHMPGARSLPYDRLVESGSKLAAPAVIEALMEEAGVDLSRPVVTTCGSGVTAALLLFALAVLGKKDVALYDGSWAEWGSSPAAEIVTGPA
jgi:thiosulfate/3-mercaptopyruvate sulfurtransferase